MRHQVEKGTFSYENKERTKREKLVRTKWAFHRFGALTVVYENGELKITFPKKEVTSGKKCITVN